MGASLLSDLATDAHRPVLSGRQSVPGLATTSTESVELAFPPGIADAADDLTVPLGPPWRIRVANVDFEPYRPSAGKQTDGAEQGDNR